MTQGRGAMVRTVVRGCGRWTAGACALLATLVLDPAHARAQDDEEPEAPAAPTPDADEPDPELPSGALTWNPTPREAGPAREPDRFTKATYPLEAIRRPLTLVSRQTQLTFELPFVAGDDPTVTQVLRAGHGVTADLELGVVYAPAAELLSSGTLETGKAFALEGAYTILPRHLAVRLSVPMHFAPFAAGVAVGAPFRVVLGPTRRWALFGGDELVEVRLKEFLPDPARPAGNAAIVALMDTGVVSDAGAVNVRLGGLYQARPGLAAHVQIQARFQDFAANDPPVALLGGVTWSRDPRLDLGGRIGFLRMDDLGGSFALLIHAAYRL